MNMEQTPPPVKSVRWQQKAVVAEVAGEIDLSRSPQLQQQLLELLDQKPSKLLVDLAGVAYMDSSGVASLVKVLSRCRRSGVSLYLIRLNDRVRSVFEITRLDSVFTICKTEQEAL